MTKQQRRFLRNTGDRIVRAVKKNWQGPGKQPTFSMFHWTSECGSPMCIAGYMAEEAGCLDESGSLNDLETWEETGAFAGLSTWASEALFDPGVDRWPFSFRFRYDGFGYPTTERAQVEGRAKVARDLLYAIADGTVFFDKNLGEFVERKLDKEKSELGGSSGL